MRFLLWSLLTVSGCHAIRSSGSLRRRDGSTSMLVPRDAREALASSSFYADASPAKLSRRGNAMSLVDKRTPEQKAADAEKEAALSAYHSRLQEHLNKFMRQKAEDDYQTRLGGGHPSSYHYSSSATRHLGNMVAHFIDGILPGSDLADKEKRQRIARQLERGALYVAYTAGGDPFRKPPGSDFNAIILKRASWEVLDFKMLGFRSRLDSFYDDPGSFFSPARTTIFKNPHLWDLAGPLSRSPKSQIENLATGLKNIKPHDPERPAKDFWKEFKAILTKAGAHSISLRDGTVAGSSSQHRHEATAGSIDPGSAAAESGEMQGHPLRQNHLLSIQEYRLLQQMGSSRPSIFQQQSMAPQHPVGRHGESPNVDKEDDQTPDIEKVD